MRFTLLVAFVACSATAFAEDTGCEPDAPSCTRAPIAYRWREGLPVEFEFDTNWQPSSGPVQVRIRAALVGNTEVRASGELVASWPEPMLLRALGSPASGALSVDYGVQFSARIRLALEREGGPVGWEGAIPFTPMVDFRAMARNTFDPWAWGGTTVRGVTARARIAEVSLTDAIVRIPGVRGGFSFEAAGEVSATYRSLRFSFGTAADPITETAQRTLARFDAGPIATYEPRLEGALAYTGGVRVYPQLFVTLAGRRWTLDLAEIPIRIGPFDRDLRFDPSRARLPLPDFGINDTLVDFGDVEVGRSTERTIEVQNVGEHEGSVLGATIEAPFRAVSRRVLLPARSRTSVLVGFAPVRPGPLEETLVVTTTDPDTPRMRLRVRGNGVGAPMVPFDDAGVVDAMADGGEVNATNDGGCGCHARRSSSHSTGVWLVFAWMVGRRAKDRRYHGVSRS